MSTVVYDDTLVPESEVFDRVFWDDEDKVVYLVFKNGTVVSRTVPEQNTTTEFRNVDSWGQMWNQHLKARPVGPDVDNGTEFVHRSQVEEGLDDTEAIPVIQGGPDSSVDESVLDVFYDVYGRIAGVDILNLDDDAVESALEAVINLLAERNQQVEPEYDVDANEADEPLVEGNDDEDTADVTNVSGMPNGTFVGVGFFDVPADVEATLVSLLSSAQEFVNDNVRPLVSAVERVDVNSLLGQWVRR